MTRKGASSFLAGAAVAILLVISVVAWSYGPTINQFFQQKEAANEMADKIQDADYAIDNYEWFKTQKQKIDQKKRQIENVRSELRNFYDTYGENASSWSYVTKQRHSRLQSRLTGQKQMYQKLVADYNARSSMQTRNVFKGKLPYEMEKKFWTGDLR